MNLPYGYTNETRRDRQVVRKTYAGADARQRFETELAMYRCLEGQPFMPELVNYDEDRLILRTRYIDNRHAQDLLEDNKVCIPRILGQLARELHTLSADVQACLGWESDAGILVHGDFGPQNLLFALDSFSTYYLVDWEWTHIGELHEDIAWAEWILRMHYHADPEMLDALYEGFGVLSAWDIRQRLMVLQCERILDRARSTGDARVIAMWQDRLARTRCFSE